MAINQIIIEDITAGDQVYDFMPWELKSVTAVFKDPKTKKKIEQELEMPSPDWEADSLAKSADSDVTDFEDSDVTITISVTQSYGDIFCDNDLDKLTLIIDSYDDNNDLTFQDLDDVEDMFNPIDKKIAVEEEEEEESSYNIDSYTNAIPIERLVSDFEEKIYQIPPFQRTFVWDQRQTQGIDRPSMFIDSVLLGLPISPIILYKERTDREQGILIDGLQRLSTLSFFKKGKFPSGKEFKLTGDNLKCPKRFHNKLFEEFEQEDKNMFDRIFLAVTLIRQLSPEESASASSMHLIFQRLNTGGLTLTPQETRAVLALKNEKLLEFLTKIYTMTEWNVVFGMRAKEKENIQQEFLFRAYVFAKSYQSYKKPLQKFLDDNMEKLIPDTNDITIIEQIQKLLIDAKGQLNVLFCPPGKNTSRGKHHVALFDAIFVALYHNYKNGIKLDVSSFLTRYDEYVALGLYKSQAGRGSADVGEIKGRIEKAISVFSD